MTHAKEQALCAAVRKIREVSQWTQEQMAQRVGIAAMTISRFELGKQVPRDLHVLIALRETAAAFGLESQRKLFSVAISNHRRSIAPPVAFSRAIVKVQADGEAWEGWLNCGHQVVFVVWPREPLQPCAQCLNEYLEKNRDGMHEAKV